MISKSVPFGDFLWLPFDPCLTLRTTVPHLAMFLLDPWDLHFLPESPETQDSITSRPLLPTGALTSAPAFLAGHFSSSCYLLLNPSARCQKSGIPDFFLCTGSSSCVPWAADHPLFLPHVCTHTNTHSHTYLLYYLSSICRLAVHLSICCLSNHLVF